MIVAGIDALELDHVFGRARRNILLYAPPYGNFASNEAVCEALHATLARPGGASLTVFCLPAMARCPWTAKVMRLLRPRADDVAIEAELAASRRFVGDLKSLFWERVTLIEMPVRPSLPAIIVDDQVFFGHFAHAPVLAPEGFWCAVQAPVESLFAMAYADHAPDKSARDQRAAFRIVAECAQGLELGRRLDAHAAA